MDHMVKVRLADGTIKDCRIEASTAPPWRFRFSGINLSKTAYEGSDLFEAMVSLRRELEPLGALLLCAGARFDVYPSGMSHSMSAGRKAYATRMQMPATPGDLVDIFDYADPKLVGTVDEQRKYHYLWIASVKGSAALVKPLPGEVEEAKRHPNGWVYRIVNRFGPNDFVPPEAIVGAWKVDAKGEIVGGFIQNEKYDPKLWPPISKDRASGDADNH
jgi:hypothetical protein